MIVPEEVLAEIFAQMPSYVDGKGDSYKVNFSWGSDKDLLLYLKVKKPNKYPLIWLVQGDDEVDDFTNSLTRKTVIILAKNAVNETDINPTVWRTEFKNALNPMYINLLKCLNKSGVTQIDGGGYKTKRRANYTEESKEDKTKTIDFWNVIVFEGNITFTEKADGTPNCINTIKF